MSLLSRTLSRAVLTMAALALPVSTAFAQGAGSYPERPVKLVVPFPPGGAADTFARLIGEQLGERWGQPAVVENKPGSGGLIATQYTARAAADGYTFLIVTVGHAVNPSLYSKLPYDTTKDLVPVAMVARLPSVLVVHPSVPAKSVGELVALVKANPGKYTYASSGNATTSHVAGAMFASLAGLEMLHVPYRGSAPAVTDLIGGQVQVMIDPVLSSAQHVRTERLRALAVTTTERSSLVPDLPTLAEAGVPGYDFAAWFMLIAPAGTPDAIVQKMNQEVARIVASDSVKARYTALGAEPAGGTPAELKTFLDREIQRFAKVAKDANMKVD